MKKWHHYNWCEDISRTIINWVDKYIHIYKVILYLGMFWNMKNYDK